VGRGINYVLTILALRAALRQLDGALCTLKLLRRRTEGIKIGNGLWFVQSRGSSLALLLGGGRVRLLSLLIAAGKGDRKLFIANSCTRDVSLLVTG